MPKYMFGKFCHKIFIFCLQNKTRFTFFDILYASICTCFCPALKIDKKQGKKSHFKIEDTANEFI